MLSIFAVPKPFAGHVAVIQRNAIESWKRIDPSIEIILLGDEQGTRETAETLGACHVAVLERNALGTPLLSSIFAEGEKAASNDVVCYANSDIIFLPGLLTALDTLLQQGLSRFLMVGSRWDVNVTEPIDFGTDWVTRLWTLVSEESRFYVGFDYFIYPKGVLGSLPPFAIGRGYWDRWLLYHAYKSGVDLVDATTTITPVHQNHKNPHHPTGKKGIFYGEEAHLNKRLAGVGAEFETRAANWRLADGRLRRLTLRQRLSRQAYVSTAIRPSLHPFAAFLRRVLLRTRLLSPAEAAK